MSADAIVGLNQRHAQAFDRLRGRGVFECGWLARFRALIGLGGEVRDLGCGMGEPIATPLIAEGHGVTGADSSPGLLDLARGSFPEQHWTDADMPGLDPRRYFAGILAWNSFSICRRRISAPCAPSSRGTQSRGPH